MCGIIGCVGRGERTADTLVSGLETLEYRGYDSAGIALGGSKLSVCKAAGEIAKLKTALGSRSMSGEPGIGHTRWSTHGPPTDENAHPHADCTGDVAVVHNGIIENYQELRAELDEHTFTSETDTEVIPHLIEAELAAGTDPEDAFRAAIARLEGSYAVVCLIAGCDAIFGTRKDSPLVLGIGDDTPDGQALFVASDVPAFREYTDRVVYLDDGEFVRLDDEWVVTDSDGVVREKSVETVDWDPEETGKSGYEHFMLKEIHEQPRALRQCLQGRVDELGGSVTVDELDNLAPTGVQFVACGTSYHAALYGAQLFREQGIPAQAFLASEYATAVPPIGNDLVVAITQSGETADTLSALREASRRGAETLAVTNTVGSTVARESDRKLFIRAGPEIGVAATKTFASQLLALNLLVLATTDASAGEVVPALRDLPGQTQALLDDSGAEAVAEQFYDAPAYFFIGRRYQFPVALEGALKLKEISYKHAEGFAAGELKHGPLALVDDRTPVFAVVTGDDEIATKTVGNIKEVEARDAPVVAVTDRQNDAAAYADHVLELPETHPHVGAVLANVQLQLVAYHIANRLGRPIDKPRNLAKSVTVE
ncbi:glutamine--fructose-6-phosphate transaminase (isomerizing) [Halovenus marina]|uniref:glutamine--fructose-6-phosphate transaminase (isomerizing) n=1 Tax=Halovenus marina TaxID=3396621 RepID=UPI003F54E7BE